MDRATFIRGDKLARVRKQLGLGVTVAEIKKKSSSTRGFFEEHGAFAVARHTGTREEVEERGLEIIREEASILAASQLGYSTRKQMGPVALAGERAASYAHFLAVSSRDAEWFGQQNVRTGGAELVVFDGRWKRYCNQVFFTKLLQILRKEVKVEAGWREELRRATIMVGESVGANDHLKSFTWNWVVLEMLLTRREDTVREALPKRAEALLGWAGFWGEDK